MKFIYPIIFLLGSGHLCFSQINSKAFASALNYSTPIQPNNAVIADFDDDLRPDIAAIAGTSSSGALYIYRNLSSPGAINLAPRTDYVAKPASYNIVSGDIDGDGKIDLITNVFGSVSGTGYFSVYQNNSTNGTISFNYLRDYNTSSELHSTAMGDIDGDGKPEFIGCAWTAPGQIKIYRNTSTSGVINFDISSIYTKISGNYSSVPVVADFDGDGKNDVAIVNSGANSLSVFLNTSTIGSISLANPLTLTATGYPTRISSTDFDNDGKRDIVVSNLQGGSISIYKNTSVTGTLSFASAVSYATISTNGPAQLQCADFDLDGKHDVLVGTEGRSYVSVFTNFTRQGTINTNTLGNRKEFSTGASPEAFAGDIDCDGKPDIITTNRSSNSISILRNQIKPSNGLIAHYPFSGNAGDSSGYENHATVYGPTLTTDRFGNPNSAYLFNGNNDYILAQPNISLRPDKVSIAAWIKSENKTINGWNTILTYRYSNSGTPYNSYAILTHSNAPYNNKWTLVTASSNSVQTELINKKAKTDGVWTHIVGVIDGSTMKLYTNGVLDTSYAINIPAIQYGGSELFIGHDRLWFPDGFQGVIDDIKIYNRGISAAEVWELYGGVNQKAYYTKSSGAINLLSSWGTNPDGSGTSPLSFDSANVIYNVVNNTSPSLSGSLKISGTGSSLIIGNGSTSFNLSVGANDTLSCDSVYLNNNITLTAQGHFATGKLNSSGSSNVQYLGSATQYIAAGIYNDIIVSSSIKYLTGKTIIKRTLGMLQSIHTNGHNLVLGTDAINKGTLSRTQGTIIGKFTRWFDASVNTAAAGTFPVGTSGKYAPVQLEFTTPGSTGGPVTAEFIPSNPGNTGLPAFDYTGFIFVDKMAVDGYWKITSPIAASTFTLSVTANNFSGVNAFADLRLFKRFENGSWNNPGTATTNTGTNASFVIGRTNLNDLEAEYGIGGDQSINPLPVKLLDFSAQKNSPYEASLTWRTASEINADKFVVQRSTDQKSWTNRNEIAATGNSSKPVSYKTTDIIEEPTLSYYYRLVQYDLNGENHTSKIIQLKSTTALQPDALIAYPNPTTQYLTIEGLSSEGMLYDKLGVELQKVSNGTLNVIDLAPGLYFIRSGNQNIRFIKQ